MNQRPEADLTELILSSNGSSLGTILEQLRNWIPARLIGTGHWECLLARAQELPASLAAFPFGFEIPMQDPRPRADLGVTITGGSRTASFFKNAQPAAHGGTYAMAVGNLIDQMEAKGSEIRKMFDQRVLLEFDIGQSTSSRTHPGMFLYSQGQKLAGRSFPHRNCVLARTTRVLATSGHLKLNHATIRHIAQISAAVTPEACIRSIGVFPSRGNGIRIAVTGMKHADAVARFLRKVKS